MMAPASSQHTLSGAPIRIIFMGTPDFAVSALQTLLANKRMPIIGVITQPDRPVGREQKFVLPPVKVLAEQHKIHVFQPKKLRDPAVIEHIRDLKPDLIVVVAYGQIIPKTILEIPKYGTINVHGSLLPKYRGASPIQAAIAAGETETGITIMLMDEEMDHGPMIATQRVDIATDETGETLFKKLAPIGAELLMKTIPNWVVGILKPQEQDHTAATYCKLLKREDGKIDWNEAVEVIERKIRAYTPWPGTWTTWNSERLNILKARVMPDKKSNIAGGVVKTINGFAVQCRSGALEIIELQLEGKKPINTVEFLHGHPEIIKSTMG